MVYKHNRRWQPNFMRGKRWWSSISFAWVCIWTAAVAFSSYFHFLASLLRRSFVWPFIPIKILTPIMFHQYLTIEPFDFYYVLKYMSWYKKAVFSWLLTCCFCKLCQNKLILLFFTVRIERLELFDEFEEWYMMQVTPFFYSCC